MPGSPEQESKDHDTLIQVVTLLDAQARNSSAYTEALNRHELRDQASFDALRKDVLAIQKVVWLATGILLAVQILPTILKVTHILNK
jgi:hypothetical protein